MGRGLEGCRPIAVGCKTPGSVRGIRFNMKKCIGILDFEREL